MSKPMNKMPEVFKTGIEIDLPAMLKAREQRFYFQQKLLSKLDYSDNGSLLLMTMVIPGQIKSSTLLNRAFNVIQKEVLNQLDKNQIIQQLKREENTGLEFYILSTLSPYQMKEKMIAIEENHPLGRLFDLDILKLNKQNQIEGISRTQLGFPVRRCFICNKPAKECGRSQHHTIEELQNEISYQITDYFSLQ